MTVLLADESAEHGRDVLLAAMTAVRVAADVLETVVADDLWPRATYQEMLFILSSAISPAAVPTLPAMKKLILLLALGGLLAVAAKKLRTA